MRINQNQYIDISLGNSGEIAAFRHIVELATRRLQTMPMQHMIGSPLHVQDGIKGTDLLNVKNMLTKFSDEFSLGEPALEPTELRTGGEPAAQQAKASDAGTTDSAASDDDIPPHVRILLDALGSMPHVSGVKVVKLSVKH